MSTTNLPSAMDTVVLPLVDCFTPTVARRIVDTPLAPQVQRRLDQLAPKANEGQLTRAEQAEYAELVTALDTASLLKAFARDYLERHAK